MSRYKLKNCNDCSREYLGSNRALRCIPCREEARKIYKQEWQLKNKEHYREYFRLYMSNRKEYNNNYRKNRRKNDPQFRVSENMRTAVYLALRGNKNERGWQKLVGYSLKDLIAHLEKLFDDKMNWNNYGKWHIDHIKPISLHTYKNTNDKEFKECWALSNLQPLWAKNNQIKYNKLKTYEG